MIQLKKINILTLSDILDSDLTLSDINRQNFKNLIFCRLGFTYTTLNYIQGAISGGIRGLGVAKSNRHRIGD